MQLNAQLCNCALKLKECLGIEDNCKKMKSTSNATVDKAAKFGSNDMKACTEEKAKSLWQSLVSFLLK